MNAGGRATQGAYDRAWPPNTNNNQPLTAPQYEQNKALFEMALVNEKLDDAYSTFRDFIVTKWGLVRGVRARL